MRPIREFALPNRPNPEQGVPTMPKATDDHTAPDGDRGRMDAHHHPSTTRRNLLRGSTVIAVAGAVAAVPTLLTPPRAEPIVADVAAHAEPDSDPAIMLYQRYRAIEAEYEPNEEQYRAVRSGLIERHGERLAVWSGASLPVMPN
jgi:hypothetical protein